MTWVRARALLRSRTALALLLLLPWAVAQNALAPAAVAAGSGLKVEMYRFAANEPDVPVPDRVGPGDLAAGDPRTRTLCYSGTISDFTGDWGAGVPFGGLSGNTCGTDYVLLHATGFLTIPGKYDGTTIPMQFRNQSKDGVYLTLKDPTTIPATSVTAIDNWTDTNPYSYSPAQYSNHDDPVSLLKGISYDIDLWYFHYEGQSLLNWYWSYPAIAQYETVPATALTLPTDPRPRAGQLPLVVTSSPTAIPLPSQPTATAQLSASGGAGRGAVTYAWVSGPCTVTPSGLVTPTGSGPCYVTATKADDGVFASLTSDPLRVNVLYPQTQVTFDSSVLTTMPYLSSQHLAIDPATGSGSGAVSYALISGDCTLDGDLLTVINVNKNCVVTATKAADADYDFSTSSPFEVKVAAATQDPMTVVSSSNRFNYIPGPNPATATLTRVSGGSGDGALSYQVALGSLAVCSVTTTGADTATVTALNRGDCDVSVTKAADSTGLYTARTLQLPTIVIDPIAQTTPLTVTASPSRITYNPDPANLATTTVTVTGGDGTGALNLTTTSSTVCVLAPLTNTVSSATWLLTAGGPGNCDVSPSRSFDNNYVALNPGPVTIPVADQVRTAVTAQGSAGLAYTYGQAITPVIPVTATGGVDTTYSATLADGRTLDAIGTVLGLRLDPATGELSGTMAGTTASTTLTITATDINGSTSSQSVSLSIAKALPTLTWLSRPSAAAQYGTPVADMLVRATGATGPGVVPPSGAITYVPLPGSEAVCAIGTTSGVVSVLRAGVCQFGAIIAADANYVSTSLQGSLSVSPTSPTPPRSLQAAVSDDRIVVSWNLPADDGGTAIASYTARAVSGGITSACSVGGGTQSCAILGVTQGSTYVITATATNSDIGLTNGLTSIASLPVTATVPYATVRFAAGTIGSRYDPAPVTSALDNLSSSDQQDLLDAGIVVAPANAPLVTITANMGDATYSTPINITVPQSVDSGSEVRMRVVPPSDTPLGSVLVAGMTLPTGKSVSLGNTVLNASAISGGVTLVSFAMVTPGNYMLTVRIADPAAGAAFVSQARTAVGVVHQTVAYAIKVVAGSAGVPTIAAAPVLASPTPSIVPSPTDTPTPTPTPTDTAEQAPAPSPTASLDDRGLVVVNPLDAPVAVAKTAVAAVALVSAVSAAASAAAAVGSAASAGSAAAAGGGAAGGAAGGARGGTGSSGGSAGGSGQRNDSSDNVASIQTVDVEHESYEDLTENWGDALPIWGYSALKVLDRRTHDATVRLAPISPLLSKLLTDGAYTRAIVGVFSAVLPIAGIILAFFGIQANGALLLPPPTAILIALAVIGVLDAAAGALAMGVFVVGMSLRAGLHGASDVRLMLGLMILGFGPALLAGAFRGIRRNAASLPQHWWERVVDLGVAPFIGGWATKGMVEALPALSGVQLPVAAASGRIGLAVAIALAVRVVGEEFTAQYFPGRLNTIHPTEVPAPPLLQKAVALAVRAAVFFFVADAFIGHSWYLWVGTVLFILPNYVGLFAGRFPNSTKLYHLLPAGLPGMAFTLLIASTGLVALTHVVGETPQLAKIAFAVLPVPSALFQILAMFGREPRAGDVRWYLRDDLKWLYWIGGPVVLVYTMHLAGII